MPLTPPRFIFDHLLSSDFVYWAITKALICRKAGLPIKRRTARFVFDMFTSNTDADRHPDEYPLEKIKVPTLVIHAVDDPLAAYENAEALAARIPSAKLLSVPSGGHLLLGMEQMVRSETAQFLQSVTNSNELQADVSFRGE